MARLENGSSSDNAFPASSEPGSSKYHIFGHKTSRCLNSGIPKFVKQVCGEAIPASDNFFARPFLIPKLFMV